MDRIWICAVAKMEELYIKEWVEWNKQLGVDHIIIGDNNDSDYDKPLLPIIQDYINEGYVELINKNGILNIQLPFYREVYSTRKKDFDWIGFIDIDEFIELPGYENNIHKFLEDTKFKKADAIILPWLLYTDNNNLFYEEKPVRERFKDIKAKSKVGIKFFVRSLEDVEKPISIHNPERCKTKNNFNISVCDCLGDFAFERIFDLQNGKYTHIKSKEEYYNTAYISHYLFKSTEEYILYRMLRGRGDRKPGDYKERYTLKFYFDHNLETEDKKKMFELYNDVIQLSLIKRLEKYKVPQS